MAIGGSGDGEQRISTLAPGQILLEHQLGPDAEIDRPLLVPFAQHHYTAVLPVHLLQLDTNHLAQAVACGDQEFHDGVLLVGLAAVPQLLQLLGSQGTPSPHPVDLQGFDLTCGIFLEDLFHLKPAEKGAQGIDMDLDAALLQLS